MREAPLTCAAANESADGGAESAKVSVVGGPDECHSLDSLSAPATPLTAVSPAHIADVSSRDAKADAPTPATDGDVDPDDEIDVSMVRRRTRDSRFVLMPRLSFVRALHCSHVFILRVL